MKILILITIFSLGCATSPRKRFLYGSAIGASAGAAGGALLSPNSESRSLNAVVWGLAGAVIGGISALFSRDDGEITKSENDLQAKELFQKRQTFVIPSDQNLPAFVKERIQAAVVEEYMEGASIGEDGTLREPHKVWRIKRPAELNAKPLGAAK